MGRQRWGNGARRVLIAADFDGTLCPLEEKPDLVQLPPALLAQLREMLESRRVTLAVISGRALEDLKGRVPLPVVLAGSHGLEIAGGGLQFQHSAAADFRNALVEAGRRIGQATRNWPGSWLEDKGLTFTLHYRQVRQGQAELVDAARQAALGMGAQILLRQGKEALEILPKIWWNKGSALRYIRRSLGPFDECICLGDDATDEDMFRANRGHINIQVGQAARTSAQFSVHGPQEVAALLRQIAECG